MRTHCLIALVLISSLLTIVSGPAFAEDFEGCNEISWAGTLALWIGMYSDIPYPVCKNDPYLQVSVNHRFGAPSSWLGCVNRGIFCFTSPASRNVVWQCGGGSVFDACNGQGQVVLTWGNIGFYTVSCSLNPPSQYPSLPVAKPEPEEFLVGVYEMYSVTFLPSEIRPRETAEVRAMIVPGVPAVTIHFRLTSDGDNAGHILDHHTGPRPAGSLKYSSMVTGATCIGAYVSNTYTAPEVSGENRAWAKVCNSNEKWGFVRVKIPGLVALGQHADYTLYGDTDQHNDGWYVAPGIGTKLQSIATAYRALEGVTDMVKYNDASLKWGGKFDIDGLWSGSHAEHREGREIDAHWKWLQKKTEFETLVRAEGGNPAFHTNPTKHYHLEF